MILRFIIFTSILSTVYPLAVSAQSLIPLGELPSEPSRAADQLRSAPELLECSVKRTQALWQAETSVELGEVPCQYLGNIGGPSTEDDSSVPPQAREAQNTTAVNRRAIAPYVTERPLEICNPPPSNYLQLIGPSPFVVISD